MISFICNEAIAKLNKGNKIRNQVNVELEIERELIAEVMKIEAYPAGTHFKVTLEPIMDNVDSTTGEVTT